jgi:hypothetical protein
LKIKKQQMYSNIGSRIENLDIRLFSAIESQTSNSDRKALLLLQRCIRNRGDYTYLEVGSYKGGTLQPFYADLSVSIFILLIKDQK